MLACRLVFQFGWLMQAPGLGVERRRWQKPSWAAMRVR